MTTEFRCTRCGKLIQSDASGGGIERCPSCHKRVAVPEALALLPRPKIPMEIPKAGAAAEAMPGEEEMLPAGLSTAETAIAGTLPWVISVFFHVGLVLVMMLVSTVIIAKTLPKNIIIPVAEFSKNPGGVVNPGEGNPNAPARQSRYQVQADGYSSRETAIPGDTGKTDKRVLLIGMGSAGTSGGNLAPFGLTTGGSRSGPKSPFFGDGGNAHHVCYVIDRSGSMVDTFDRVRYEMFRSIGWLIPEQDFHVILFASGAPMESWPRRLVAATKRNKADAVRFLMEVRAEQQTDPIPALNRAFDVLAQADPEKPGKVIHLLTDAVFPDNAKVLDAIRKRNQKKDVRINTYLYGRCPVEAEAVMKQIALDTRGRFKYISPDE